MKKKYSKIDVLKNIKEAIQIASFSVKNGVPLSEEQRMVIKECNGFGGNKSFLWDIKADWGKEENLKPLVIDILNEVKNHDLKNYDSNVESLKNSILSSYYTPDCVVNGIVDALKDNNIFVEEVLDPSAGANGIFAAKLLEKYGKLKIKQIEKDNLSFLINAALFGGTENVKTINDGFENISNRDNESYDLVISNIPFGNIPVFDNEYYRIKEKDAPKKLSCQRIHNYFFVKALDKLKNGGVLAFITSDATLKTDGNRFLRKYLVENANILSVKKLPHNLFEKSGTSAGSDLIILQKNINKKALSLLDKTFIETTNGLNNIFTNNKNILFTTSKEATNQYGKPETNYFYEETDGQLEQQLHTDLSADIKNNYDSSLVFQATQENQRKVSENPFQLDLFSSSVLKLDKLEYNKELREFYKSGTLIEFEKNIYKIEKGEGVTFILPVEFGTEAIDRLKAYIQLRDTYYELNEYETTFRLENEKLRQNANRQYDLFVERFGGLNSNLKVLGNDPHKNDILRLEKIKDGKLIKADFLIKPTAFANELDVKINTIEDAIASSLNTFGKINLDYIALKLGANESEIVAQLKNLAYYNVFSKQWDSANNMLIGDLYRKIQYFDKNKNEENQSWVNDSITYLKNNLPIRIPIENINVNLGVRWLPVAYYNSFFTEVLQTPIDVNLDIDKDIFTIKNLGGYSFANEKEYAVKASRSYNGVKIAEFALMDTLPNITKVVMVGNVETKVADTEAIQLVKIKIEQLQQKFQEFILKHPEVKQIEQLYNELFNCYANVQYDGSHLKFSDMDFNALGIKDLYKSQKDCIWMNILNGGGIVDHEVGGGKTLIMCGTAHEMKRLGIVHKPVILCLKANVLDVVNTYKKAYPNDKILFPTAKNMKEENREQLWADIKNYNWDVIIMTHDNFISIPHDPEIVMATYIQELKNLELDLQAANLSNDRNAVKGLVRRKVNLEDKIKKKQFQFEKIKDKTLSFDKLGIDFLLVDESHKFKNIMYTTRHNRVAGLNNSDGTNRNDNMLFALRTIQAMRKRDLGAVFLSGTPISNSITEMYGLFKYLMPITLTRKKMMNFDSWVANFGKKITDVEVSVANKMILKERFRVFVNVPELGAMYNQIADVRTADMIGLDRPKLQQQLVEIEPTGQQRDFAGRLMKFAENADGTLIDRGKLTDEQIKAKMLICTNVGAKMALDLRLINSKYEDSNDGKLGVCAKKIAEHYKESNEFRGTQLVFCDLGTYKNSDEFDVYSELKRKLITNYHIPAHEIRFAQEAKVDSVKASLHKGVNDGSIRIFIGSTETMGTGTNVQNRVVAMHHLDIPWKPSQMEQRDGRGERPGNWVAKQHFDNKVYSYIYATKKTLDNYKFYLLDAKGTFIKQIKNNSTQQRTIDEGAMDENSGPSIKEFLAIMMGNDDMLNKAKLEKQYRMLENEKILYNRDYNSKKSSLDSFEDGIVKVNKSLATLRTDMSNLSEIGERSEVNIYGKLFRTEKELGTYLIDINKIEPPKEGKETIGAIGKFEIIETIRKVTDDISFDNSNDLFENSLRRVYSLVNSSNEQPIFYTHNNGIINSNVPETAGSNLRKALQKIPELLHSFEKKKSELENNINQAKASLNPWGKEEQLLALKNNIQKLDKKIQHDVNNENELFIKSIPENTKNKGKKM